MLPGIYSRRRARTFDAPAEVLNELQRRTRKRRELAAQLGAFWHDVIMTSYEPVMGPPSEQKGTSDAARAT